jgi:hypothetical protein
MMAGEEDIALCEGQKKKHNFHFVLARSMKERLKNLDVFEKSLNFSQTINRILSELTPLIKVKHKWGEQQRSKYLYVSEDEDEKRDHVYAYLDEDVYRKLKLIHQDLNFYSIGQILRGFCEFFLDLVDEFGRGVFKVLARNFEKWKDISSAFRLTFREELQHLLRIIPLLPGGKGILTIYDSHFTPFYIRRL